MSATVALKSGATKTKQHVHHAEPNGNALTRLLPALNTVSMQINAEE